MDLYINDNGAVKQIVGVLDPRKPAGSLAARYSDGTYGVYMSSPWHFPVTEFGDRTYATAEEAVAA